MFKVMTKIFIYLDVALVFLLTLSDLLKTFFEEMLPRLSLKIS